MLNAIPNRLTLVLSLAVASAAAPGQDAAPSRTNAPTANAADLPTTKDVITRAIDAMGGSERIEAITSTIANMELTTPMGPVGMKMSWERSGKMLIEQSLPNNMGSITMGFDGKVGWMNNSMQGGYNLLPEDQVEQMKGQANILMVVSSFEKEFAKLSVVGREIFAGENCIRMRLEDEKGEEGFAFFSDETGLLAGIQSNEQGPTGPMIVTLKFSEWKEQDGLRFFRKMIINNAGLDMEMLVKDIQLNTLKEADFALPEEVKALIVDSTPQPNVDPGEGG